jgi:hypothetical protein
MQQHNLHADLADYGVAPLSENLKILWFKEGITDRSFDVVKMNVIASPERYAAFQAVKEAYSTFHRQRCLTDGPQARQVSAIRGITLKLSDQIVVRNDNRTYKKRNTIGWKICCQWKDGLSSWEKLSDLKESHPIETAEYAVAMGIDHEPAFNWWVPHVLKKRDRIISAVARRSTCYLKRTHKFGIEVPKTAREAIDLDRKNSNTLWTNAISKEMTEVRKAFELLPDGMTAPVGYQKIPCHMIFDVKMEDFKRKARLVAGGHKTEAPATITYASVVSRETVRIALMLAALNDLQVKVGDVLNAYITAPVKEKVWTVLGPEFGQDAGKSAIIVRALYGLKSAGAAFRAHLASFMRQMGYKSCKADPDLWLKAETRPDDNVRYYSYILCYVDDILCIHHDAMSVLNQINGYLPLKPTSVGDPDIYLSAKLKETQLPNGIYAWGLSPSKYVNQVVEEIWPCGGSQRLGPRTDRGDRGRTANRIVRNRKV